MDDSKKVLIEKATQLYMRFGIKSVSMEDIARHLGISKKTLYHIVKDKNELVALTIDNQLKLHQQVDKELKKKNLSSLDELYEIYKWVSELFKQLNPSFRYDLNKYYPILFESFMIKKTEQIYNNMRDNLIKGKKEGVYRKEMNEDIIALMHATRHNYLEKDIIGEARLLTNKETFEELFLYHIHAVLNNKGREELKTKKLFSK